MSELFEGSNNHGYERAYIHNGSLPGGSLPDGGIQWTCNTVYHHGAQSSAMVEEAIHPSIHTQAAGEIMPQGQLLGYKNGYIAMDITVMIYIGSPPHGGIQWGRNTVYHRGAQSSGTMVQEAIHSSLDIQA